MNDFIDILTRHGIPVGIAAALGTAVYYGPRILTALGLRFKSRDTEEYDAAKQREADELRMRHNMEADIDRLRIDIKELRADHEVCEANHRQCQAELSRIRLQIDSIQVSAAIRSQAIEGVRAQIANLEDKGSKDIGTQL